MVREGDEEKAKRIGCEVASMDCISGSGLGLRTLKLHVRGSNIMETGD